MLKLLLLTIAFFVISLPISSQENNKANISTTEKKENYFYDHDLLPKNFHAERRNALRELMPEGSVAIIFSNPIRNRSNDVDYEYHQDPNFYYLSGFREPNALLLIFKEDIVIDSGKTNEILYIPEKDAEKEVWTGRQLGTQATVEKLGIKLAQKNTIFTEKNFDFSIFSEVIYINPADDIRDDKNDKGDLYNLVKVFRNRIASDKVKSNKIKLKFFLDQLREIKQPEELALIQKAIDITCDAQIELMKSLTPEMKEYQTEALVEYIFKKEGAEHPGFPSIMGSGENSCILHYTSNRKPLLKNELLVSDIGAEYHGYTADVTRTLPVNGKFSEEQKIIYNLVLQAQEAGIEACKAGNKFWDPHTEATKVITEGLLKLGIIKNSFHVNKYFTHGTSHYLGLDVHDAGTYGPLKENSIITVEPGIYIPEGSDCDKKWWNIGVRIEDDILITASKPVILSGKAPRKIEEIELLMKEKGMFEK
ncbi:MAG: Xaa-Pro aminopeptidase [Bacteroidota bacterium]|nr:MAG: Xaa-Pro aminopeptidase [Bacteroidota bacterium]